MLHIRFSDLNRDLNEAYGFGERFDLVINLGTAEHCFDQRMVFKNLHNLCRVGGLLVHAVPVQGNVNHGFYNYHPRFFADLAAANEYEIVRLDFTVDYDSELVPYELESFREHDSRDILFYAILRRTNEEPFRIPFDGMFSAANTLTGYVTTTASPLESDFAPYLKGGSWEGTKGFREIPSGGDQCRRTGRLADVPAADLLGELAKRVSRRFRLPTKQLSQRD